ncbi:MAG: ATP-dependent DNA helicase RecG [Endomicrobium sp.]|jgi:ATP-dependent DNA helicase RecG|nr:ATP-dependent DNA helicase RecG [Endomicrobium sp.]
MLTLDSKIQFFNGVGYKRSSSFAKLGIKTIGDLLTFFPVKYQDRTRIISMENAWKYSQGCVFGEIGGIEERIFLSNLCLLDVELFDGILIGYVRFFRKKSMHSSADVFASIKKKFEIGNFVYAWGNIKVKSGIVFVMASDYEIVQNKSDKPLLFGKVVPVYHTVKGITQNFIRETVKLALNFCELYPDISNSMPDFKKLPKLTASLAIKRIHYPGTLKSAQFARKIFAIQEFFILEVALLLFRKNVKKNFKTQKYEIKKTMLRPFKNNLGFEFTRDQKKAINNIFFDMQSVNPMNRMLVGDVGSGKTVVAFSATLLAVENDYQVMIIVPTEILAEQHYLAALNAFKGLGIKIVLSTSSILKKKSEREKILIGLKNGYVKIAIGTHSLIEDKIKFKNLSLIIVDEQHRFGVMQKFDALDKAQSPDVLMITATPIPRALAIGICGAVDITTITQLPPGRLPVKTYFASEQLAYTNAIEELKKGNQVYIVFPVIDKSKKFTLKSVIQESKKLSQTWFKDFKIDLLYGKMKSSEKTKIMQRFKDKEFNILISTTVIGVGIDISDATVMIIQHADIFGLSVLHQLRGRVGRSSKQSYLYLIGGFKSDRACKRLSIIRSLNDGIKVSEEDLKIRGPGELMGTLQHGFHEFKTDDLVEVDADILDFIKKYVAKIVEDDPTLSQNTVLKKVIYKRFFNKIKLINVG